MMFKKNEKKNIIDVLKYFKSQILKMHTVCQHAICHHGILMYAFCGYNPFFDTKVAERKGLHPLNMSIYLP
ncbi:hypothetical protein AB205_0074680 [Aquarana catesbeiana]|uniref:Uncharacterized protein n=1 Tax=Aquarana catesbeiana TaxID=8400 RepID=A0A2G9RG03_AQUCT|nr:hypothetical protein AB205_0074680 [Aquarana catesbeiana]